MAYKLVSLGFEQEVQVTEWTNEKVETNLISNGRYQVAIKKSLQQPKYLSAA